MPSSLPVFKSYYYFHAVPKAIPKRSCMKWGDLLSQVGSNTWLIKYHLIHQDLGFHACSAILLSLKIVFSTRGWVGHDQNRNRGFFNKESKQTKNQKSFMFAKLNVSTLCLLPKPCPSVLNDTNSTRNMHLGCCTQIPGRNCIMTDIFIYNVTVPQYKWSWITARDTIISFKSHQLKNRCSKF